MRRPRDTPVLAQKRTRVTGQLDAVRLPGHVGDLARLGRGGDPLVDAFRLVAWSWAMNVLRAALI
jgi:hypothetical protein